jgi:hypothetical protein
VHECDNQIKIQKVWRGGQISVNHFLHKKVEAPKYTNQELITDQKIQNSPISKEEKWQ